MFEEPKALENSLREAAPLDGAALYREVINQAPEGIFIAARNGCLLDINQVACAMLGYEREELLEAGGLGRVLPEAAARLQAGGARLVPGQAWVDQWSLRRKDGTSFPTEVNTKILSDGRWVAFVRDISDSQRSTEKIRRSEEALNRAQQIAHLGSWDWQLDQSDFVCSPELFAIFGITPAASGLDPESFSSYVHPDDRDRLRSVVSETKRRGGSFQVEYRLMRPDATERSVLSQGVIYLEAGTAVRVVGTVLDITDRKRAERGRDESLQWLRAVLAQSPVGMMLVHGPEGERIEANEHLQRLTGGLLTPDGNHPDVFLTPEAVLIARHELPSMRALRGEQLRLVEYLIRNDLGDLIPVLASATPIRDDSGKVQGAVVAFQDITPVKELERMRAEWNTIIAHDLRQPLNTIALSTGILTREAGEMPGIRRPIDWIVRATRRLTGMIEELFDLSRLEARQLALSRKCIDLPALVRASVEVLQLESAGRRFEVRVQGELARVEADGDRIAQVLENLLTNAVKYSFAETAVVIGVEPIPGHVAVTVTNSGPGISPDELPMLFQRFRRTDTARKSAIYGIGLGLYIARQLIEAHGGCLTAESTPGTTTTFRFVLPLSQAQ